MDPQGFAITSSTRASLPLSGEGAAPIFTSETEIVIDLTQSTISESNVCFWNTYFSKHSPQYFHTLDDFFLFSINGQITFDKLANVSSVRIKVVRMYI